MGESASKQKSNGDKLGLKQKVREPARKDNRFAVFQNVNEEDLTA